MKRVCLILLAFGCTLPAKVAEEDLDKVKVCTDTRDGEVFEFNTNDVTVHQGFGTDSQFTVVDSKGQKRAITAAAEAWLKCKDKDVDSDGE